MSDPLLDLEQTAQGNNVSEQRAPVVSLPPFGGVTMTPKEAALQGMPFEWRERIIAEAADFGIKGDGDSGWLLIGSFVRAWAAAAAAGASAEELTLLLQQLPKLMQDAFTSASKDFRGQVRAILGHDGKEFMDALRNNINLAANAGADKLKSAAATLDSELTRKIEIRKDEGVELWTKRAMDAADLAIAKHKAVNFYFNTIGGATIFILGSIFGAFLATHI